jgi:hypothetical protein
LIVNANIKIAGVNSAISGKYEDFSVDWYRVVGSTLVLAMAINILSIHFSAAFKKLFFATLRWFDRKFTLDKRKTRKLHQDDYEK